MVLEFIKKTYRRTRLSRLPALTFLFLINLLSPTWSAEQITLFTYHDSPPFVIEKADETGLTFDLAQYLTRHAEGEFTFSTRVLPRERLNELIAEGVDGLVPWGNHFWFDDPDATRYLWSSGYFPDEEAVISHTTTPFNYDGPESLFGKRVGCVSGYHYPSIDDFVSQGKIERFDVRNQYANLQMILKGRNHVAFMPRITADYYIASLKLRGHIHYSPKPESVYTRQFMIMNGRTDLAAFIEDAVKAMLQDPEWAALVEQYR